MVLLLETLAALLMIVILFRLAPVFMTLLSIGVIIGTIYLFMMDRTPDHRVDPKTGEVIVYDWSYFEKMGY